MHSLSTVKISLLKWVREKMAARAVVLFFLSSAPSLLAEECGLVSSNVETEVSADNRILGGAHVPVEGLPWQVVFFFSRIQSYHFVLGPCETQTQWSKANLRRSHFVWKVCHICRSLSKGDLNIRKIKIFRLFDLNWYFFSHKYPPPKKKGRHFSCPLTSKTPLLSVL